MKTSDVPVDVGAAARAVAEDAPALTPAQVATLRAAGLRSRRDDAGPEAGASTLTTSTRSAQRGGRRGRS